MHRSKVDVYVHFVWATYHREPLLVPDLERPVWRAIESEARKLGCVVLAIGGVADHVHVFVRLPAVVTIAKVAQQMKGVSSKVGRDLIGDRGAFGWQDNYAAMSVSRHDEKRVIEYVQNQKSHHGSGKLWPEAEQTWTDAPGAMSLGAVPDTGGIES